MLCVFVWVCTIRRKVKVAIAMFAVLPIAGRRELIFLCYFLSVRGPSADQVHDVITDARPRIEGHVHDVQGCLAGVRQKACLAGSVFQVGIVSFVLTSYGR